MKKLLVVDDDPDCTLFLKKILEHSGYQVAITDSGEKALLALAKESFDGMFLDIFLSDIDGYTVAMKTREKLGNNFPIIVLTGYSLETLKKQNPDIEKVCSEICIKPLGIQSLVSIAKKFF
jgi:two-component system response regulator MprA